MHSGSRRLPGSGSAHLIVVVALVGLAVWLLAPATATAHSYLAGSDPADGATLSRPPEQITLTFSDPVRETGLGVTATGPQGPFPLTATAGKRKVVAQWPDQSAPGEYQVSYRAVSDDGHVMEGRISFSITGSGGPDPRAATNQSADPGTPEVISEPVPGTAPSDGVDPDKAPGGVPPWVFFFGALIAAAGIAVGVMRGRKGDQ